MTVSNARASKAYWWMAAAIVVMALNLRPILAATGPLLDIIQQATGLTDAQAEQVLTSQSLGPLAAELRRAESAAREVLRVAPDDAYAHLLLGRTLQRAGRHDEARGPLRLAELLGGYDAG